MNGILFSRSLILFLRSCQSCEMCLTLSWYVLNSSGNCSRILSHILRYMIQDSIPFLVASECFCFFWSIATITCILDLIGVIAESRAVIVCAISRVEYVKGVDIGLCVRVFSQSLGALVSYNYFLFNCLEKSQSL